MRVVYAVPHPIVGAVAERVLGVSRSILATGKVDQIILLGPATDINACEISGFTFITSEGILKEHRTHSQKVLRRVKLGLGAIAALEAMQTLPDLLIVYGGGALYMSRLHKWARDHRVRIAADMVEWYDSTHLPLGRFGPYALDNQLMMGRVAHRSDGIIAISRFLTDHFTRDSGASVVTVPPIRDTVSTPYVRPVDRSGPVHLVYCGDPGKKDRLDLVLRSVIELDPRGEGVRLTVAGPSPVRVAEMAGVRDLPTVVEAVGRVSRRESQQLVRRADWMPLIRERTRSANAGFPTKVAEAMTAGTPVIANLTSDLDQFLHDGENGLVVDSPTVESTQKAIVRAVSMSYEEHYSIAHAARQKAIELFDYRAYVAPIGAWLEQIMKAGA